MEGAPPKKRGSYNCGRCGLPKKGHVCAGTTPTPTPRRALSFADDAAADDVVSPHSTGVRPCLNEPVEILTGGALTAACLAEVLRRLPPREVAAASAVSRGWREVVRSVWYSAEEIRLRVTARERIGFVGSVLNKCEGLVKLSLTMESDADATVLACVAFACPSLEEFEMNIANNVVNRITGDELSRFVSEKRSLSVLKIEGCTNLGSLNLYSSSLSTLRLSDLQCISKTVISCPNLKEISLDFTRQESDYSDLVSMMDCLGRTCPRLRNIHIASIHLCNEVVLALSGAKFRCLRILSLIFGSKITDASVAAIVSSYKSLELLDLSGSSISDSGIGMICNVFPHTLTRLLLALCPNITSSGIQFAAAQLPFLQLFDCGMSISDLTESIEDDGLQSRETNGLQSGETNKCQKLQGSKTLPIYQKLIIKHGNLKRLSLWGCSGLDALYLNCPVLNDLNLNLCTNLNPESLVIECPKLKNIHASGCQDMLIGAIHAKVFGEFSPNGNHFERKRLADGSKRVQVPHFFLPQPSGDEQRKRLRLTKCRLIT